MLFPTTEPSPDAPTTHAPRDFPRRVRFSSRPRRLALFADRADRPAHRHGPLADCRRVDRAHPDLAADVAERNRWLSAVRTVRGRLGRGAGPLRFAGALV